MSKNKTTQKKTFAVSTLYIQLDTNTGEDGERNIQLFKRSMLKMPKMVIPPILTSEYPFFTKDVRYPSTIESADWKTKYEFFFNREIFRKKLAKVIEKTPNNYKNQSPKLEGDDLYEWTQETEKHNVMVTLRALFPIPEVFGKTLKNSFEHVLQESMNSRVIWDVNVLSATNIFGFMYKFGIASKEKEEYFINIGGKRYEVNDVVWENDVVNHPIYNEFLLSSREPSKDVESSSANVKEKNDMFLKKLTDELNRIKPAEIGERILTKTDATSNTLIGPNFNTNNDRKNTAKRIAEKMTDLNKSTGDSKKSADIIISIKESIDNHTRIYSSEGISVFMDAEDEREFDRLLKMAIEVRASSIVLEFVQKNIPMNLSDKKLDGTDVSPITKRINQYIREYFGTEANMNNSLFTNANNVLEPIRKTSNKNLYKMLQLFKFGDAIMMNDYGAEQEDIDEYRSALDQIYEKYIALQVDLPLSSNSRTVSTDTNVDINKYLYTGIDEVKGDAKSESDKDGAKSNGVKSNVQEIYVRFDLVDADTFGKASRASCKLFDKGMEQDFKYLADPRNRDNTLLSRFRDLQIDITSDKDKKKDKNTTKSSIDKEEPTAEKQKNKNKGGSRRIGTLSKNKTMRRR